MEFTKQNVMIDHMKHASQIKNFEIWIEDYDNDDVFLYNYYINRFVKIQEKSNCEKKIKLNIHSYGGSAHGVFSMISTNEQLKKKGWIIETISFGMSMSAGGMLLMSGSKGHRHAQSLTEIMIHQQNWFDYGYTDVEATRRKLDNSEKMLNKLKNIMKSYTGIDVNYFEEEYVSKRKDWYLSSEEAKTLGVIDHIL
jgi:ATP-dependent Clp protease protease subunit